MKLVVQSIAGATAVKALQADIETSCVVLSVRLARLEASTDESLVALQWSRNTACSPLDIQTERGSGEPALSAKRTVSFTRTLEAVRSTYGGVHDVPMESKCGQAMARSE